MFTVPPPGFFRVFVQPRIDSSPRRQHINSLVVKASNAARIASHAIDAAKRESSSAPEHGGTSIKITQVHVHGQAMKQRAYQKIVAAYVEINSAEAAHRLDLSRGYEAAQDIVRAQDRVSEVDDLEMLSCVWEALRFLSGVGEVNFAPHRDHNEATARADRARAMFKDVAVRKSRRYVQKKWKEADERERKVAEQSKQLRRATSLVCAITGVGLLGTFIYFATAIPNEPR